MESLHRDSSRIGPWLWLSCFQFFVAEQITRLGWPGHYSMARDYISDLGSARSPLHWVMNGSFMLQGLLIFLGAVLVRPDGHVAWRAAAVPRDPLALIDRIRGAGSAIAARRAADQALRTPHE